LSNTTQTFRESSLEFMKADSTDLSAFKAHGGKLLIVHGASDPTISILDTFDWWRVSTPKTVDGRMSVSGCSACRDVEFVHK